MTPLPHFYHNVLMAEDSFETGANRMENTLSNPALNEHPSIGQKLKSLLFGNPAKKTATIVAGTVAGAALTVAAYNDGIFNSAESEAKGLLEPPHSQEYKVGFGPYYGKPISNGVALDREGNEVNNINGLTNGENRVPQKYRIQQSVPAGEKFKLYTQPNEASDQLSFEDAKALGIDVTTELRAQPVAGATYGSELGDNKMGYLQADMKGERIGQWWQVQGLNAEGKVVTVNMKSADVRLNNPTPVIEVRIGR